MGVGSIIAMLIVGAVAGWLAGKLVKGHGFGLSGNIVVGIVGALIAVPIAGAIYKVAKYLTGRDPDNPFPPPQPAPATSTA